MIANSTNPSTNPISHLAHPKREDKWMSGIEVLSEDFVV